MLKLHEGNCIIPCEGIFADIRKEDVQIVDDFTKGMKDILVAYEKYKNLFFNTSHLTHPSDLLGECSYIYPLIVCIKL